DIVMLIALAIVSQGGAVNGPRGVVDVYRGPFAALRAPGGRLQIRQGGQHDAGGQPDHVSSGAAGQIISAAAAELYSPCADDQHADVVVFERLEPQQQASAQ